MEAWTRSLAKHDGKLARKLYEEDSGFYDEAFEFTHGRAQMT